MRDEGRPLVAQPALLRCLRSSEDDDLATFGVAEPVCERVGDHPVAESALAEVRGLRAVEGCSIEGVGMRYGLATCA